MRTRLRLLAAVVVLGLVAAMGSWFAFFRDKQTQPAPPKTTAELLIGTWKMTKWNDPLLTTNDVQLWVIFAEGNRFESHIYDRDGHQIRSGTYKLEGMTIHLVAENEVSFHPDNNMLIIELISDGELILVERTDRDVQVFRAEFERTNEKHTDGIKPRKHDNSPVH